jgi:hypothetical protein
MIKLADALCERAIDEFGSTAKYNRGDFQLFQ